MKPQGRSFLAGILSLFAGVVLCTAVAAAPTIPPLSGRVVDSFI
jgi:hypothetical protein